MGLTRLRECTPGPLRRATSPYVPAGTATDIWVSTRPFPRAGIVMSTALFAFYSLLYIKSAYYTYLYRSYPADNEEPLVGNLAFSNNRLIRAWWVVLFQCHPLKTLFFFSLRVWHRGLKERRVSWKFNGHGRVWIENAPVVYGLSESLSLLAATILVKFVR